MKIHLRTCHDASRATTLSILECIENCIRPEEYAIAFEEIYRRVKAGIESYVLYANGHENLANPSQN